MDHPFEESDSLVKSEKKQSGKKVYAELSQSASFENVTSMLAKDSGRQLNQSSITSHHSFEFNIAERLNKSGIVINNGSILNIGTTEDEKDEKIKDLQEREGQMQKKLREVQGRLEKDLAIMKQKLEFSEVELREAKKKNQDNDEMFKSFDVNDQASQHHPILKQKFAQMVEDHAKEILNKQRENDLLKFQIRSLDSSEKNKVIRGSIDSMDGEQIKKQKPSYFNEENKQEDEEYQEYVSQISQSIQEDEYMSPPSGDNNMKQGSSSSFEGKERERNEEQEYLEEQMEYMKKENESLRKQLDKYKLDGNQQELDEQQREVEEYRIELEEERIMLEQQQQILQQRQQRLQEFQNQLIAEKEETDSIRYQVEQMKSEAEEFLNQVHQQMNMPISNQRENQNNEEEGENEGRQMSGFEYQQIREQLEQQQGQLQDYSEQLENLRNEIQMQKIQLDEERQQFESDKVELQDEKIHLDEIKQTIQAEQQQLQELQLQIQSETQMLEEQRNNLQITIDQKVESDNQKMREQKQQQEQQQVEDEKEEKNKKIEEIQLQEELTRLKKELEESIKSQDLIETKHREEEQERVKEKFLLEEFKKEYMELEEKQKQITENNEQLRKEIQDMKVNYMQKLEEEVRNIRGQAEQQIEIVQEEWLEKIEFYENKHSEIMEENQNSNMEQLREKEEEQQREREEYENNIKQLHKIIEDMEQNKQIGEEEISRELNQVKQNQIGKDQQIELTQNELNKKNDIIRELQIKLESYQANTAAEKKRNDLEIQKRLEDQSKIDQEKKKQIIEDIQKQLEQQKNQEMMMLSQKYQNEAQTMSNHIIQLQDLLVSNRDAYYKEREKIEEQMKSKDLNYTQTLNQKEGDLTKITHERDEVLSKLMDQSNLFKEQQDKYQQQIDAQIANNLNLQKQYQQLDIEDIQEERIKRAHSGHHNNNNNNNNRHIQQVGEEYSAQTAKFMEQNEEASKQERGVEGEGIDHDSLSEQEAEGNHSQEQGMINQEEEEEQYDIAEQNQQYQQIIEEQQQHLEELQEQMDQSNIHFAGEKQQLLEAIQMLQVEVQFLTEKNSQLIQQCDQSEIDQGTSEHQQQIILQLEEQIKISTSKIDELKKDLEKKERKINDLLKQVQILELSKKQMINEFESEQEKWMQEARNCKESEQEQLQQEQINSQKLISAISQERDILKERILQLEQEKQHLIEKKQQQNIPNQCKYEENKPQMQSNQQEITENQDSYHHHHHHPEKDSQYSVPFFTNQSQWAAIPQSYQQQEEGEEDQSFQNIEDQNHSADFRPVADFENQNSDCRIGQYIQEQPNNNMSNQRVSLPFEQAIYNHQQNRQNLYRISHQERNVSEDNSENNIKLKQNDYSHGEIQTPHEVSYVETQNQGNPSGNHSRNLSQNNQNNSRMHENSQIFSRSRIGGHSLSQSNILGQFQNACQPIFGSLNHSSIHGQSQAQMLEIIERTYVQQLHQQQQYFYDKIKQGTKNSERESETTQNNIKLASENEKLKRELSSVKQQNAFQNERNQIKGKEQKILLDTAKLCNEKQRNKNHKNSLDVSSNLISESFSEINQWKKNPRKGCGSQSEMVPQIQSQIINSKQQYSQYQPMSQEQDVFSHALESRQSSYSQQNYVNQFTSILDSKPSQFIKQSPLDNFLAETNEAAEASKKRKGVHPGSIIGRTKQKSSLQPQPGEIISHKNVDSKMRNQKQISSNSQMISQPSNQIFNTPSQQTYPSTINTQQSSHSTAFTQPSSKSSSSLSNNYFQSNSARLKKESAVDQFASALYTKTSPQTNYPQSFLKTPLNLDSGSSLLKATPSSRALYHQIKQNAPVQSLLSQRDSTPNTLMKKSFLYQDEANISASSKQIQRSLSEAKLFNPAGILSNLGKL